MAHLSKRNKTTNIRVLERRLWRVVVLPRAGACPVGQKGVRWGQLAIETKGSWIYQRRNQGCVGNLHLWLAFK